mmetsp:Transcript_79732/g.141169  ORF Transcript_79732/g.141169 Transcript_79732/m.141169 type:complete len:110 (+) Transcript_79732:75-404(+)
MHFVCREHVCHGESIQKSALLCEESREPATTSTRFTAFGLTTLEVVEIHVRQSANFDRRFRIMAETTADGIGNDPKPLTKFIDEAEGELPVANSRSDKENSRNFCGLVV